MTKAKIHFSRGELSGAFGDIGTDLPLITGMILVSGMPPARVLGVFGLFQMASALFYGIPMPVQPLKAVAVLVIAGGISASQVYGAGFSIGLIMLVLSLSGLLDKLRVVIPVMVIRGIQLGLGLKLALLALGKYIPSAGLSGLLLAVVCFMVFLLLRNNRHCPPALPIIALGVIYALVLNQGTVATGNNERFGFTLPDFTLFSSMDILQGLILLALPQIPLSLGNSLFATHQMATDLFPERRIKLRTIGFTYSILNIVGAFFAGIPVCHGSSGMAGHYAFGGRTGGSVFIYGIFLLALSIFWGSGFGRIVQIFPLPVLGVILLVESGTLMSFAGEHITRRYDMTVALVTALCAAFLPYGFMFGMLAGTVMAYIPVLRRTGSAFVSHEQISKVENA